MKAVAVTMVFTLCSTLVGADELFDEGKKVFTNQSQPSCSICHSLKDAEAGGVIGPDLNDLKPNEEQILKALNGGVGVMPDYSTTLSQEQMKAVAHYVVTAVNQ